MLVACVKANLHRDDKVEDIGRSQLPTSLVVCMPYTGRHFEVVVAVIVSMQLAMDV
jgi:hypothetical protein